MSKTKDTFDAEARQLGDNVTAVLDSARRSVLALGVTVGVFIENLGTQLWTACDQPDVKDEDETATKPGGSET